MFDVCLLCLILDVVIHFRKGVGLIEAMVCTEEPLDQVVIKDSFYCCSVVCLRREIYVCVV